jgi:hypothetical protein
LLAVFITLIRFKATAAMGQHGQGSQGGTLTTRLSKPNVPNGRNALIFNKSVGLEKRRAQSQLVEAERMSAIGWMACSTYDQVIEKGEMLWQ